MSWRARLTALPWRLNPHTWPPAAVLAVVGLAALAWIVLATGLLPMSMAAGPPTASIGPPWICGLPSGGMKGMSMGGGAMGSGGPLLTASAGMPMWSLMALAMMLPAALPATSHVALNSLRRRRARAVAEFLLAYLLPWLAFGALALLLLAVLPANRAALLLAAALGLAALWELSPGKRWALNRCHRTSPLPPHGWRASLGATRFGIVQGGACVASCWPLMVVMTVAPSARLAWCAGLGGVSLGEKLAQRPRRNARRVGLLLGLGSVVAALAVPLLGT